MNANEIKVGHIYYVKFDPVKRGEFDKNHLAVVIKKNANRVTFVVIPMTSNNQGVGINKVPLGVLTCLPPHLQNKDSYAVIDQVRTLNAERFSPLSENGSIIDAEMPEDKMDILYKSVIKDLLHDVPTDRLLRIFL